MSTRATTVALTSGGWREALDSSGFWDLTAAGTAAEPCRVLILVDLGGARPDDPDLIAPAAVERLIDLLHEQAEVRVDLAASGDETQLWAGNRDIYALAELLGYRFVTDAGHDYDIVDLAADPREGVFPETSALHGSGLSEAWLEADVRLNLARLRAEPAEGFAAGLMNLIGCLPQADKALHYRHRRNLGEVLAALLDAAPPHHTLIQLPAIPAADGMGSETDHAVACASPVLADYAAALKAGIDPFASPVLETVVGHHPLPSAYRIAGSLEPVTALRSSPPLAQAAAKARQGNEAADRLVAGWLRRLDPELFPAARPIDAKAREIAAVLAPGRTRAGPALLTAANLALAAAGKATEAWRTLFDKDALVRRAVSLGIDPATIPPEDFASIVPELEALLPIAAAAPERGPGLRWRKFENAVLFEYRRSAAIPFDLFVARVDVARTISFMNDYLGGVLVVVERDASGRPIRQAERNLYLPQPNYVVLYGGKPIDVTKIEVVRYAADAHRLYWKTLASSNGSATADDGVAFFEREGEGTRITIAGKQRFTLPPLLQVFDPALLPDLEAALTTDAYQRFFDRTYANLEALVEGREIMMGRAPEEPSEHPSIVLEERLKMVAEKAGPLLERFKGQAGASTPAAPRPQPDEHGFVHVVPQR